MNYSIIIYILGWIMNVEAVCMLVPGITALIYREKSGIAFLITILTTGNADAAVAVQASHKKIFAEIQLCKRDISYGRFLTDRKFQCFWWDA